MVAFSADFGPRHRTPAGQIANLKKPLLLSSGMSSWSELDMAVQTVRKHHDDLTVLQCTSEYPGSYERVGLNMMKEMRQRFGLPVGHSDHTLMPYASLAAVTLGASVIERHCGMCSRQIECEIHGAARVSSECDR